MSDSLHELLRELKPHVFFMPKYLISMAEGKYLNISLIFHWPFCHLEGGGVRNEKNRFLRVLVAEKWL